MGPAQVRLYFDPVSPYSWLALEEAPAFAERHDVTFGPIPVVYAALLDAAGLVGPAESPSKRRYTFVDVLWCAHRRGLRLVGPPAHPFRSIDALRTVCLFLDQPEALELARGVARAAWRDGRDLTDLAVLASTVEAAGLDSAGLGARIAAPGIKRRLRDLTEEAIRGGVFGVPTFVAGDSMFWGHDRMEHLGDCLDGRGPGDLQRVDRMLERPRGADRRPRP